MEWIKNNIITLVILLCLGFLVYKNLIPKNSYTPEPNLIKQLDSAKAIIVEKITENKALIKENEEAEKEKMLLIEEIKNQINLIQPKYIKVMSNYNKASPEQKKQFTDEEYQRRKIEMDSESGMQMK
jgi:hypothetical protein